MKLGTVWDAWRLARERQRIAEHLADGCQIGSKAYAQYMKDIKKLERQGYHFVDKIIDTIQEYDAKMAIEPDQDVANKETEVFPWDDDFG